MSTIDHHNKSVTAPLGAHVAAAPKQTTILFRRIAGAGLGATSLCLALMTFAPPAMADPAPVIHVGSDTRNMAQPTCMQRAEVAIRDHVYLQPSRLDDAHVAGVTVQTSPVGGSVLVTCQSLGERTFIEVVGTSLDSATAEHLRNTVREFTMGPPS